jgi:hypothetical protein
MLQQARPLASVVSYVNGEPVETQRGAIVSRSDNGRVPNLAGLAGALLGAQSLWSIDGFLLQVAELRHHGVGIWTDAHQARHCHKYTLPSSSDMDLMPGAH